MFDLVGFVADGMTLPSPVHDVVVYRAAAEGFEHGMSWTEDLSCAAWFHRRNLSAGLPSAVYRARFTPADLLAYFNESTGEHEWVVRPAAIERERGRVDLQVETLPEKHPGFERGELPNTRLPVALMTELNNVCTLWGVEGEQLQMVRRPIRASELLTSWGRPVTTFACRMGVGQ